jgi:hypothetical protein
MVSLTSHESISAATMILFELGVLMRIFKRDASLFWPSLVIAPSMAVAALKLAPLLAAAVPALYTTTRLDYSAVFMVALFIEIPLSMMGYQIFPPAKMFERLVVAGSFAVVSVMTAKSILGFL